MSLKGLAAENQMTLNSRIIEGQNMPYYNQIQWTLQNDGTVLQVWNINAVNGDVIQTLFYGIYEPVSSTEEK